MIKRVLENRRKWLAWLLLLLVWSITSYILKATPIIVPKPHEVIYALGKIMFTKGLRDGWEYTSVWPHLFATLRRMFIALCISVAVGIPTGVVIGSFRTARESLDPIVAFFRAIPVTALTSVFLLIFGFGDSLKIAMATFSCSLLLTVGASEGIRNTEQEIIDAARIDGANDWDLIRHITFWTAMPHIYANFRVAVEMAAVLIVVTEMFIGGRNGMGYVISNAHAVYDIPEMWATIILLGIVGITIYSSLERFRVKFIPWLEE